MFKYKISVSTKGKYGKDTVALHPCPEHDSKGCIRSRNHDIQ